MCYRQVWASRSQWTLRSRRGILVVHSSCPRRPDRSGPCPDSWAAPLANRARAEEPKGTPRAAPATSTAAWRRGRGQGPGRTGSGHEWGPSCPEENSLRGRDHLQSKQRLVLSWDVVGCVHILFMKRMVDILNSYYDQMWKFRVNAIFLGYHIIVLKSAGSVEHIVNSNYSGKKNNQSLLFHTKYELIWTYF